MKKILTIILFVFPFFSNVFSQSIYLGYRKDCFKIQASKIDKILYNVIGSNRYNQLLDIQCCEKKYRLVIQIIINSNGIIQKTNIKDEMYFLLKSELDSLKEEISRTIFDVCIMDHEMQNITKEEFFKNDTKTAFLIALPRWSSPETIEKESSSPEVVE